MLNKPVVAISTRLYLILLFLYPAEHRHEYGTLMVQAFRDLCREAYAQTQGFGLAKLWVRTLKDLVVTAFVEHFDTSRMIRLCQQSVKPWPWWTVLLATLPGITVLCSKLGTHYRHLCLDLKLNLDVCTHLQPVTARFGFLFHHADSSQWFYAAFLGLLLVIGGFVIERRLAVWSFPALGVLLPTLPRVALATSFDPRSGPPSPGHTLVVSWLWPALMWGIVTIVAFRRSDLQLPGLAWGLLGLLVLANPFTLLSSGAILLLSILVSLLLARRDGLLAGLLVVAGEFWIVDSIFDPSYGMLIWSYNYPGELIVSVLPTVFFLIIPPIWILRAHSTWGRTEGLLYPPLIGLVGAEIIHSIVVRGTPGAYSPGMWFVRGTGMLQYVMALVIIIYAQVGNRKSVTACDDRLQRECS
jgi:hypothetical protein